MGRKRKDGNPLGLEPRVYWHHGQFIYRHRDGTTEQLGTDLAKANDRARIYNDPEGKHGTIAYFLELYIAEAKAGRLLKRKSPRTIADYEVQAPYLTSTLGKLMPLDLVQRPELITQYRDNRTAKVRANRELSLLSAMFSWLIEKGLCPGLTVNPVLLIARNPETPKERYVDDSEYSGAYGIAQRSVCMAMAVTYLTLQRPEDVLRISPKSIKVLTVRGAPKRVLAVTQGKTGRTVNIEVTPELDEALAMQSGGKVAKFSEVLVHDLHGYPYTVGGIGAMLRRYCIRVGVQTFGLMDVRAKGATDMYLRGVPLEQIQALMGHKSVQTTEIYIKRMLATVRTVAPNERRQEVAN